MDQGTDDTILMMFMDSRQTWSLDLLEIKGQGALGLLCYVTLHYNSLYTGLSVGGMGGGIAAQQKSVLSECFSNSLLCLSSLHGSMGGDTQGITHITTHIRINLQLLMHSRTLIQQWISLWNHSMFQHLTSAASGPLDWKVCSSKKAKAK